jgi:hypothetical protein
MLTGVSAMKVTRWAGVLEPQPLNNVAGAYPLTAISYAAVAPLSLDKSARKDFSDFIKFATTSGQVPGVALGQLPLGYAPLPESMRKQATATAARILTLHKPGSGGGGGATTPPVTDTTPPTSASDTTDVPGTTVATSDTSSVPDSTVPVPSLSVSRSRLAIPAVLGLAMVSGLGALEITKRPKRRVRKSK